MNIFLHVCCAPDLTVSYEKLKENGYEPTCYFYNPNIYPKPEYIKRKDEVIKLSNEWNFEIIEDSYDYDVFFNFVKDNLNNRCEECIKFRLENSAKKAKSLNYDFYTTTLLASPRKSHSIIKYWGEYFAKKYGVDFLYINFRSNDGVQRAAEICRTHNIYRQKYCGCSYSLEEAHELEIISKKRNFNGLSNLIGEEKSNNIFSLYKKDILRIPEDLPPKYLYEGGLKIIKFLKPVMILMKKNIADDFMINSGRVKIDNWKAKFLIW